MKMKYKNKKKLCGYLYCLPWIIGFFAFFAVPIFETIRYSFCNVGVSDNGGMLLEVHGKAKDGLPFFYNYISLFTEQVASGSRTFIQVFTNENTNILVNAPIIIIFSLFLAILANMKFKAQGVVRTIFFLPIVLGLDIVMDMITISTGGDLVTRGTGMFSQGLATMLLLKYTSIDASIILTVTDYVDNIFSLISQAGVQTLIYLAGLQSISPALYEVAKIEGATTYESFWKVTIPMIGNISVFVIVYTVVDLFLESSIASEVYRFAFSKSRIGIASALSVVYMLNVLLILMLILLIAKLAKRKDA